MPKEPAYMTLRRLGRNKSWYRWVEFSDSIVEKHMAIAWSTLNMNWGRIEWWLHNIISPVDPGQAHEWTLRFFATTRLQEKIKMVQQELQVLGRLTSEPRLDDILVDMSTLCEQRNKLVHGLWRRISDGQFEVQPLDLDDGGFSIAKPVTIDLRRLVDLTGLMNRIVQRLANVGSETVAYRELRKMDRRREVAARRKQEA